MRTDPRWPAKPPSEPPDVGLHQRVAQLATMRPHAPALVAGHRRLSYGELDATADAWAAALARAGVGPGERVPVLMPRSPELVVALLAVLKTGAAYALLDPAWPAARIREVTAVLDPPLVVAADPVPDVGLPHWVPPGPAATAATDFRPVEVAGDAPCCVFFTSGTTGRPKGVLTPHRATARLFVTGTFATFDEHTVIPLAAPSPWDAFSLELWGALLNGGTSVIVGEPYLSAGALREGIAEHGVNTAWLTSSLFNMVVDEDPDAFRGLHQLLIGGERLSPAHVDRFLRRHPGIALLNGYGPVESTVFATTHRITPADPARPGGVPLGRPVPGTRVYVLDGERPTGVDEVGEICIAGDGLAAGYLGDEALTAEKFVTVRVAGRSMRAYRTGDLGRLDADGLLHFQGRADRQVKLRGHRIEPAEVERRLEELLPVRSCRVVVDPGGDGEPRLVAWCVPEQSGDRLVGAPGLLRSVLPAYQVPAEIVSVENFPVTPQGKLDERALLGSLRRGGVGGAGARAGDLPAEAADGGSTAVVAEVFGSVLGVDGVPLDVPFPLLGGSSLDMGRVCARLAARLDRPVPVVRLVEHPTAAALGGWLDATRDDRTDAEPPELGVVPLTPMQLVYLTRQLLEPTDLTGHCLLTWVIEGDLDRTALRRALEAVHLRHEPLRAAYLADPRPVAQVVDIEAPPLETLPAEPSVPAAVAALRSLFAGQLLIGEADVWRAAVVEAGDATVFGCVVHHIAFDGWSEAVFARDLAAAYNAARHGRTPPAQPAPPSLARSYRDYTRRLAASGLDRQREQLRERWAGLPTLRWPAPVDVDEPTEPGLVELPIGPEVVAAVDAGARAAGVSRFASLLHHFAAALADVTDQRDFAVGVPVAQRHGAGSELAVGCHLTMLCLRLSETALGDGPAAVQATWRCFTQAFAAQDVPLPEVLRLLDLPGGGRPPLFQTLFAVQDNAPPVLALDGVRTTFVRQPYLDLPLELHAELWPTDDGGLRLTVYFRPDAVAGSTAEELVKRMAERLPASTAGGRP